MARPDLGLVLHNLNSVVAHQDFFVLIIWAIRAFYILSSVAILTARLIPALNERFLDYGAREQKPSSTEVKSDHKGEEPPKKASLGLQFLDYLANLKVPHSWFIHFYLLSVACTALQFQYPARKGLSIQARSASLVMLFQGVRRLIETLMYTRKSSSRMWIGHYVVGLAFYLCTNLAIFTESAYLCQQDDPSSNVPKAWHDVVRASFFAVFVIASRHQCMQHYYLSQLKKYTLPDKDSFKVLIAPHYTLECILYISLAFIAAPAGFLVNWTLLCATVFVVVNLGVTADGTKRWMLTKFPDCTNTINLRWRMFPWLW